MYNLVYVKEIKEIKDMRDDLKEKHIRLQESVAYFYNKMLERKHNLDIHKKRLARTTDKGELVVLRNTVSNLQRNVDSLTSKGRSAVDALNTFIDLEQELELLNSQLEQILDGTGTLALEDYDTTTRELVSRITDIENQIETL